MTGRPRAASRSCNGALGAVTVQRILGVNLIGAAPCLGADALEFRREATSVAGVAVGIERQFEISSNGVSQLRRPIVSFRTRPGAAPVEVRAQTWTAFGYGRVGDPVMVIHRKDDPASARLDRWLDDALLPIVLLILGIVGLRGRLRVTTEHTWFRHRWDE